MSIGRIDFQYNKKEVPNKELWIYFTISEAKHIDCYARRLSKVVTRPSRHGGQLLSDVCMKVLITDLH